MNMTTTDALVTGDVAIWAVVARSADTGSSGHDPWFVVGEFSSRDGARTEAKLAKADQDSFGPFYSDVRIAKVVLAK